MQTFDLGQAALKFVDLLTPRNFTLAQEWLSADCEYTYEGHTLRGESILQSFIQNHERAAKTLDRIEYQNGTIEQIDGRSVSVLVTDRIWLADRTHDYTDRLIVTFNENLGPKSVIRIENRRVDGEREKLRCFLESCGHQNFTNSKA